MNYDGGTVLYRKYVLPPINLSKVLTHMMEFKEAGLPRCIGSTDCTHFTTKRCKYNLKNNHLSPKSSHTTWTFNLTCNHRRRILHSTTGRPGRWNDQTMVRLVRLISGIWDSTILEDLEFELLLYYKEGDIIVKKISGCVRYC